MNPVIMDEDDRVKGLAVLERHCREIEERASKERQEYQRDLRILQSKLEVLYERLAEEGIRRKRMRR